MRRLNMLAPLLLSVFAACSGGTGDSANTRSDEFVCDKFDNFSTGEVATYRFIEDHGLEFQTSVTALEITSSRAVFYIEEQEVTTALTSRTHTFERDRGCSAGYDILLNDRELLVLGYPSQWGAAGDGAGNQRTDSCGPASQSTPVGEFAVERCTKYFTLLGADTQEFIDDVVESGATPGSGFVARHLMRDLVTGSPSALLIGWSGG